MWIEENRELSRIGNHKAKILKQPRIFMYSINIKWKMTTGERQMDDDGV